MALYAYRAMHSNGRISAGELEALNLVDLEMRLKRLELDLINAHPQRHRLGSARGHMPVRERMHFCFHLEQLTRAGVPLIDALSDLRDSTEHPRMRAVIAMLVESIEGGRSLSQALAEHGKVFDPVFCALVRAGESSGNLPEVLLALNESLKREDELGAYVSKLVIYPGFVLSVTLLAIAVSMTYVVPELTRLFHATGLPLPLQTRILAGLSRIVTGYWPYLLLGAGLMAFATPLVVATSPRAALALDRLKLGLPLIGKVYRKIILARFANLFAMMYASGIPIIDTIRVAQDVVGNRVLRRALERVEQLIAEGQNVTSAFSSAAIFPPLVLRMLRVGEYTGSLDQALGNVCYFYERDVRESIGRLQATLEPLLIALLGALMLWVALSVLGPIYDVITRMKI